jgi:hypothetical protein
MSDEKKNCDLESYLQDHYAGAVGAVDLIGHLTKRREEEELGEFFRALGADVRADRDQLENIMVALGFEPSSVRNAGAWMAEKLGRLKLGLVDGEEDLLSLLQAFDSISTGIAGKRLLWRALNAARDSSAVLRMTDFSLLESRAVDQAERVENRRLAVARRVLVPE